MPNKRGVKRNGGMEIFVKFKKREGGWGVLGISKYPLISVMNEKIVLNLKVSKQTGGEASKNKVIIKRVSNISIN